MIIDFSYFVAAPTKFINTPYDIAKTLYQKALQANGCVDVQCTDQSGFNEAIQTAHSADIIVMVMGINTDVEAEGLDRDDIILPGNQEQLIKQVYQTVQQTGKKFILVLAHGAVVISPFAFTTVPTILSIGYTGQATGDALFDVLHGDYNPSARTTQTWYNSINDVNVMVDYDMISNNGRTYKYYKGPSPHFSFGHGLSYTSFNYTALTVNSNPLPMCQSLEVRVTIQNVGSVGGDHVIPLYVTVMNTTEFAVQQPQFKLISFDKVYRLEPDGITTLILTITPDALAQTTNADYQQVLFPTTFLLTAGDLPTASSSHSINTATTTLQTTFELQGSETPLSQC